MSKHTEGPWEILHEETFTPYIRIRGTQLGTRYKIANVLSPHQLSGFDFEAEETRANARLIAAAPELLAALIKLSDLAMGFNVSGVYFSEVKENSEALDAADALFAKVEGE